MRVISFFLEPKLKSEDGSVDSMVILLVAILSDTIIVIGKYIFQKLLAKMGPLCFLSPLVSSLKANNCDVVTMSPSWWLWFCWWWFWWWWLVIYSWEVGFCAFYDTVSFKLRIHSHRDDWLAPLLLNLRQPQVLNLKTSSSSTQHQALNLKFSNPSSQPHLHHL